MCILCETFNSCKINIYSTMAMQVDDILPSNHSYHFSIGLLICFSIYLVIHIHLCTIPRASLYCLVNICTVIVSISILLIGITRNKGSIESNNIIRMVCIFISTGVLYARTASTFAVSAGQIPVNVHHLAERFGLLMMLFIGESIISLLLTEYQYTLKYYYIIHLGFLNIYLIRFIYFNLAHAVCILILDSLFKFQFINSLYNVHMFRNQNMLVIHMH